MTQPTSGGQAVLTPTLNPTQQPESERGKALCRAFVKYVVLMFAVLGVYFVLYFHRLTTIPVHEAFGLAIVVVIGIHIWFFRALFSFILSQHAPVFWWRNLVLCLLLISFVAAVVSGIAISHYFFNGWFEIDKRFWRIMHIMSSTAMLVTVGLHIGCYWSRFVIWFSEAWSTVGASAQRSARLYTWSRWALWFTLWVLALNGVRIMVWGEDFYYIMTWQQHFGFYDRDRSFFWNLTDDVSLVACWTLISYYISTGLCYLSLKKE